MPKIASKQQAPVVRKTSLGSTCAILGSYRIVMHDKKYTCSTSRNGWHREHYLEDRGWVICNSIPEPFESALKQALGI